jgi:hypothetical protein
MEYPHIESPLSSSHVRITKYSTHCYLEYGIVIWHWYSIVWVAQNGKLRIGKLSLTIFGKISLQQHCALTVKYLIVQK